MLVARGDSRQKVETNYGKYDPAQHMLDGKSTTPIREDHSKIGESKALIEGDRSFNYLAPSSDTLQCVATTSLVVATLFASAAFCSFVLPWMIQIGCVPPLNGTETAYNNTFGCDIKYPNGTVLDYNNTYYCDNNDVSRGGWISAAASGALCMLMFISALSSRLSGSRFLADGGEYTALDSNRCSPPTSRKLQNFSLGSSLLGILFFVTTVSLASSPKIIGWLCNPPNSTDSNGACNNTEICDMNSVNLTTRSILGTALFGPGLLFCVIALAVYGYDNSIERNVAIGDDHENDMRFIESGRIIRIGSGMTAGDDGGALKNKYSVTYVKKYIDAYMEKLSAAYKDQGADGYKTSYDLAKNSMEYNNESAESYATSVIAEEAKKHAEQEALTYIRTNIEQRTSTDLETRTQVSLASSTETESTDLTMEDVRKRFPRWYKRLYIMEYASKFCEECKTKTVAEAQATAIVYANSKAVESINANLANSREPNEVCDEEFSD